MTQTADAVHVCYCFTDSSGSYYKHPLTSMTSIFENTKHPVHIHIIHDETVTEHIRDIFKTTASRYGNEITFYTAPPLPKSVHDVAIGTPFGIGTLYRFYMQDLIQEKLVLYLDGDVIFTMDISNLLTLTIPEREKTLIALMETLPVAGVLDMGLDENKRHIRRLKQLGIDPNTYINAGVILVNLDLLRNEYPEYQSTLFTMLSQNQYALLDQDVINIYFQQRKINICVLPEKYNYIMGICGRSYADLETCAGKILHYIIYKPWKIFYPTAFYYWKYYSIALSDSEAFREMERLEKHEYAPLIPFMLQHHHIRRWVKRAWEVSNQGLLNTILDRIFPFRRKKARLATAKK